jgi:hypothetical protein
MPPKSEEGEGCELGWTVGAVADREKAEVGSDAWGGNETCGRG